MVYGQIIDLDYLQSVDSMHKITNTRVLRHDQAVSNRVNIHFLDSSIELLVRIAC